MKLALALYLGFCELAIWTQPTGAMRTEASLTGARAPAAVSLGIGPGQLTLKVAF